ncbi:MAG: hypothetical protein R3D01_06665 [Hyphomicrobiales bacterium]
MTPAALMLLLAHVKKGVAAKSALDYGARFRGPHNRQFEDIRRSL